MARKLFSTAALALAASAAVMLGACKANDTAGATGPDVALPGTAGKAPSAPASGTNAAPADGARRVSVAELQKLVEGGRTVIYDTRTKGAYDAEHIKGALSMPHDEVANRVAEFPRDKTLVFYCT